MRQENAAKRKCGKRKCGRPVASRKKVPESPFVASRKKVPETNHCKTAIRSIRFHPVGEAEAGSAGEQPTKE